MIILYWILQVYIVICILRVALSWLNLGEGSSILGSIGTISYALTEPLFNIVRRRMPNLGDLPVDISPTIVIVVLLILRELVKQLV